MTLLQDILNCCQSEQRTSEWYAQRANYLTSSDVATVLNMNKYSTRTEVLFRKCGINKKNDDDLSSNVAIVHGQKYEQEAIDLYADLTSRTTYNVGLLTYEHFNKTSPYLNQASFLAGSADSVSVDTLTNDSLNVLEVKCPYRRRIVYGQIPEMYYPQLQMNLHILNIPFGDFIEYIPAGLHGRIYPVMNIVRIAKDDQWFKSILPPLIEFWNEVQWYRTHGIETHPEYNGVEIPFKNKRRSV